MVGYFNTYIQRYWEDNRKVQTYTELGLSLFLMVIFLAFAIRPTLNTVLELNKKLSEARQAKERLDEKIQSISLAQANLNEAKPHLELVDDAVPQEKLILDFLNQAQLLAGQYNLTLDELNHSGSSADSNNSSASSSASASSFELLSFSLSGTGDYSDIKKFVNHLENLPRLVRVSSLNLNLAEQQQEEQGETQKSAAALNFKIEGEIYYD